MTAAVKASSAQSERSEYIYADNFDVSIIDIYKVIPKDRKKLSKNIVDVICAFDIETTNLMDIEQNIMYIWQMQIGLDYTIIGRTWEEFFRLLKRMQEHLKDKWLIFYDHNLSYEIQYLKGVYDFENDEVFCTDSRKVMKCTMFDCFEFRCSYYLTNMSLDAFTKQMNVQNQKLSGIEFDYSKIRYPWTDMTDREIQYCINDVKGLVQALYKYLKANDDTLATIPYTATGFVRRDVKVAMKEYNHLQLQDMLPNTKVYKLLRAAFRGGNTLSNRWYTDDIIEDVKSVDIVSSYPAVMLTCDMPMSKFYKIPHATVADLKTYINRHVPLLISVAFYNIDLSNVFKGAPYLSRDKCTNIIKGTFCNGRILRAAYLETVLTDLDFKIVMSMYKWDALEIFDLYYSTYKPLPEQFKKVIRKYYKTKTELKGVDMDTDPENYLLYCIDKAKLNACYGMCAQDPVKDTIDFAGGTYQPQNKPLWQLLKDSNRKAFLNYAWGVWITAWARYRLQEMIDQADTNFIYADTDSVKHIGELDLTEFNNARIEDAIKNNAYAYDRNGNIHYIGIFEDDGSYKKFKTLGAKKYAYVDEHDKLHITIAGVNKKLGADELGSIENLKEGYIFTKAGGTESIFNDDIDETIMVDGHELRITDNIVIRPSSYTIGITAEYEQILKGCCDIKYSDHSILGYYTNKN